MSSSTPPESVARPPLTDIDHVSRAVLACAATTQLIADQPYLLAERVLASGEPSSRFSPITITQLAEVQPDGQKISAAIGRIHAANGIETGVAPRLAKAGVIYLAGAALDTIRRETIFAATLSGIKPPTSLNKNITRFGVNWFKSESIRRSGAVALQEFLETTDPTVLTEVRDLITSCAEYARTNAPAAKQDALERYKQNGPGRHRVTLAILRATFAQIAIAEGLELAFRLDELGPR